MIVIEDHYKAGYDKREISRNEKKTADLSGDTLNFLDKGDETEEIIVAGGDPCRTWSIEGYPDKNQKTGQIIRSVDKKIALAQRRLKQYEIPAGCFLKYDFRDFIDQQMASESYEWTYVHADYCGLASDDRLLELQDAAKCIAPGGRLRATFLLGQGQDESLRFGLERPFETAEDLVAVSFRLITDLGYEDLYGYIYRGIKAAKMLTFWADRKDNGILESQEASA